MNNSRFVKVFGAAGALLILASGARAQAPAGSKTVTEADCTAAKLGDSIPISAIGEPVSAVTLNAPRWNPAAKNTPAYCSVNGSMAPVDKSPNAKPINFAVAFPATWNGRAAQLGGGGMNGTIPGLAGGPASPFGLGFVTYGSDSGHQMAGFGGGPGGFGGARGGPRRSLPARVRPRRGPGGRRRGKGPDGGRPRPRGDPRVPIPVTIGR